MKYENSYSNNVLFIVTIGCFLNYMRSSHSHVCTPFGPLYSGITASYLHTKKTKNFPREILDSMGEIQQSGLYLLV